MIIRGRVEDDGRRTNCPYSKSAVSSGDVAIQSVASDGIYSETVIASGNIARQRAATTRKDFTASALGTVLQGSITTDDAGHDEAALTVADCNVVLHYVYSKDPISFVVDRSNILDDSAGNPESEISDGPVTHRTAALAYGNAGTIAVSGDLETGEINRDGFGRSFQAISGREKAGCSGEIARENVRTGVTNRLAFCDA
jgi:hypothetical protein